MKVLRVLFLFMALGLLTYSCEITEEVKPSILEAPSLETENGSDGKVGPPPPPPSGEG